MTARRYLHRDLHADLETPVTTYLKLGLDADWSLLFESVEGSERWANYSMIAVGARRSFRCHDGTLTVMEGGEVTRLTAHDPLKALRNAADFHDGDSNEEPGFLGGLFGFLSYDAVRSFESIPCHHRDPVCPDALFFEPELYAIFDNRRHCLTLYATERDILDRAEAQMSGATPALRPSRPWSEPRALDSRERFMSGVERIQEHIRAGDIIQAVLSRRFSLERASDPFDVYRGLRVINPSPYLYYLKTPELALAGASPEVMVRVTNGKVILRPIAGTRPRGSTPAHDARLAQELLNDAKERAEHVMLVDLGRNDIGRVASPGTVTLPDFMVVEHYSHVMHIVSEVSGELAQDYDAFDALRAAFPAGTLSGAPKVRAMQIIEEFESSRRGVYGGAVGYFARDGNADFGIAIRTLIDDGCRFLVQAGAGIVADSQPEKEADETEHKARSVLRAARWATAPAQARGVR